MRDAIDHKVKREAGCNGLPCQPFDSWPLSLQSNRVIADKAHVAPCMEQPTVLWTGNYVNTVTDIYSRRQKRSSHRSNQNAFQRSDAFDLILLYIASLARGILFNHPQIYCYIRPFLTFDRILWQIHKRQKEKAPSYQSSLYLIQLLLRYLVFADSATRQTSRCSVALVKRFWPPPLPLLPT